MDQGPQVQTFPAPDGIEVHPEYTVEARPAGSSVPWSDATVLLVDLSSINLPSDVFQRHQIAVASINMNCRVEIRVHFPNGNIEEARIRPASRHIDVMLQDRNTVQFSLEEPLDIMLELNGNKWTALHLLLNQLNRQTPSGDTENLWYFGPGVNNGNAYSKVVDGKLQVPSGKTVYLDTGAFLTAGLHFANVSDAAVLGNGFIYKPPKAKNFIMEKQGAILIENSFNITIGQVTSLSANGFSLLAGQTKRINISGYRSFSSCGNGDGLHFLCCADVLIENCFLRNSDDTIAINCHRWNYYGNTENFTIRNCVLLPDIAHPILIGTHGNAAKPEDIRNIAISNVDILDHDENQLWYQGCIALNAGDGNLIEEIRLKDIRVEKISRGQLLNIRVMQNAMWTTSPGRGIRNITIKDVRLNLERSKIVNPSQILGYDRERQVENIVFENLVIGDILIHEGMPKPRWYMVTDFVPMFVNEHVQNLKFALR